MRLISTFLASLVMSVSVGRAEVEVIQPFEGDGFDSWQTTGEAFGLAPVAGRMEGLNGVFLDYAGNALACSAAGGNESTGTLTSPEILLSQPYLAFLIAGGNHPGKTEVRLLVDGKIVRKATGRNSLAFRKEVWDVAEYKNKKAVIQVVDDETGSWGFIAVDQFILSSRKDPAIVTRGRPAAVVDSTLQRVADEGSAATVAGLNFKEVADYTGAGIYSPASLSISNDGSIYVAETHRNRFGVEDDRANLYWFHDDLASKTVEDRRALHRKWVNKKSYESMTEKSEIVRRLSDEQADGTFGKAEVFADKFNDLLDGIGSGVMAWDDTVYYACIPRLWMLHDLNQAGKLTERKVVESGFGVRVSLTGHDMSGFVMGYDGRIYGSIGDRGFNLTTKEGRKYDSHNRGAIFRFEPDGTQFEVVHFGVRNTKEFAFDEWGNGIGVDNNSDQGDEARIIYIIEGADSGWEMEHQAMHTFHREIGLDQRPPSRWMTERTWEKQNDVQPAFIVPPVDYVCSGPSGVTYHPGTGFLASEAKHFFVCDYRGSSPGSGVWSFKLQPQGAGFKLEEKHQLIWGIAATDVDFDWKGRVVISDYVTGWGSHEGGRLVNLSAQKPWKEQDASTVAALIKNGFSNTSSDELAQLLRHADQRVRLRAQLELTRRPDALLRFTQATQSLDAIERVHGIWGLGILARRGAAIAPNDAWAAEPRSITPLAERMAAAQRLVALLNHADAEVRAQAVRALGEGPIAGNDMPLGKLILDESPRVRMFAAIAAGRLGADKFLPEVFAMLKANADADPILRHAGSMAIDGMCKTKESLELAAAHESKSVRLATVMVMRRRGDESVVRFVKDASLVVADEAIRAVHDLYFESARPAVAALLDTREARQWTPFMLRRLIYSAYRLGGEENAARLVSVVLDDKIPEEVHTEALRLLGLWTKPYPVDQFTGHWAPLPERSVKEVRSTLSQALPILIKKDSATLLTTLSLVDLYQLDTTVLTEEALAHLVANQTLSGAARAKALEMLLARKPADALALLDRYTTDKKDEVAIVAVAELARLNPERGFIELRQSAVAESVARRQAAWKALAALQTKGIESFFVEQIKLLEGTKGVSPAAIEMMEAAGLRTESAVKTALASLKKVLDSDTNKLAKWMPALEGGNPEKGFALFQSLPAGQCMRCHRYSEDRHSAGGEAGPSLVGVAKRGDRNYLLESIVYSNAVVASGYGTVNIELVNKGALMGTLLQQDAKGVDIDIAGVRWRVMRKDILSVTEPVSGMPVLDGVLSLNEVRDLVAWLATLDSVPRKVKSAEPKILDISKVKPMVTAAHIDPAVMALGRQQFITCSACHGVKGEGTAIAPPLAKSDWVNGPAERLIDIQLHGLSGPITVSGKEYNFPAPMPAQAYQTDEQIAAVLTYIRNSFGNNASVVKPEQVKERRK